MQKRGYNQNMLKINLVDPLTNAEVLNIKSEYVDPGEIKTAEFQDLVFAMQEMVKGNTGGDRRQMVGLAAPQVGVSKQIALIDETAYSRGKLPQNILVLINPEITYMSKDVSDNRENCWSCGNIFGVVSRSITIKVTALNENAEEVKYTFNDFTAVIAQHEIDHLAGIRFPDRIPKTDPWRLRFVDKADIEDYKKKWQKWEKLCSHEEWLKFKNGV